MVTLFNVGVKGLIRQNNKILLLRGNSRRDFWEAPGGRIDDNETIEQTLIRELNEELPGIDNISVGKLVHSVRLPGMPLGNKGLLLLWYEVNATFPEGVAVSDEHVEYRWCDVKESKELASFGVQEAIEKL